ncbi:GNAT family N-acetyltransferase [Sporolactobacillus shoreicorticis]|uniref:GNAT family N-acetyltransferase n=1 Tax=Sporolactobacillus shoreicorticis TaxID=1923877 RepID=A0ABW5S279_9BACL|nr:GNAT family N-acetyltransferase [Sporolactobacillus shoreicorticis]MCO7126425.1 GNAT family N-acetyltransferase [Sporolactobacillus shoreicorticis]
MKTFIDQVPSSTEFFNLYQTTGWNDNFELSKERLHQAISNSWYTLSVYEDKQLIGFGRIISDGVYQSFLCDLIVSPNYRKQGIGTEIVKRLLNHSKMNGLTWIQLSCAQGKQPFYERLGFKARPNDAPGMQLFLSEK